MSEDDNKTSTLRQQVRDMIREFAVGFSKEGLHEAKLERYVDVLESFKLEDLSIGLNSLKGESSMPAPKKIRDAISAALVKRMLEREREERNEKLSQLADPEIRKQLRQDRAELSGGLVESDIVLDQLVLDAERLGLVGEARATKLLYLALHTRHFSNPGERPVSPVLKGSSSAGKSFTASTVHRFLAPGSVIEMTGMSPKWMVYASQQGLSFEHKFVYVHEHSGIDEEVEGMLRVLLSEGRIIWRTVIDQVAHTLEVAGPTGLIETTTMISIHPENETRMLSIPVDESTKQTHRVLERIGRGPESVDLVRWHALDEWIALGPRVVVIPFQRHIGELAMPVTPRVRRDLTTFLCLVRAHALIHESQREVTPGGAVVATLDDYEAVHELTRDLFATAADLTVSPGVRQVVSAVAQIIVSKFGGDAVAHATSAEIAKLLGSSRRVVNRDISAALEGEYLDEISPQRASTSPHRVRLGARPLPDESVSIFPTRVEIAKTLGANGSTAPGGAETTTEGLGYLIDGGGDELLTY